MSKDSLYNLTQSGLYRSIEQLRVIDDISWQQLSQEIFGYKGEWSIRNIVKNGSHNIDPIHLCIGMKKLSSIGNLRLHKHALDTTQWTIAPRAEDQPVRGHLDEEVQQIQEASLTGNKAIKTGNLEAAEEEYRKMQKCMARYKAELENLSATFDKEE